MLRAAVNNSVVNREFNSAESIHSQIIATVGTGHSLSTQGRPYHQGDTEGDPKPSLGSIDPKI